MPAKGAMARDISHENDAANPVVEHLQRELANAFVLYGNYKHYHWQTFGPLFRDLHLMFDDFAEAVLKTADDFAERLRMIGQDPIAGLPAFEQRGSVHSASRGSSMREMVEEADANLQIVIKDMRDAARVADDENDPGTVDLFSKVVQIHEKHEWFLRQVLKKKDGLTS
jgi:starvation-inducible DNA-binding protein